MPLASHLKRRWNFCMSGIQIKEIEPILLRHDFSARHNVGVLGYFAAKTYTQRLHVVKKSL